MHRTTPYKSGLQDPGVDKSPFLSGMTHTHTQQFNSFHSHVLGLSGERALSNGALYDFKMGLSGSSLRWPEPRSLVTHKETETQGLSSGTAHWAQSLDREGFALYRLSLLWHKFRLFFISLFWFKRSFFFFFSFYFTNGLRYICSKDEQKHILYISYALKFNFNRCSGCLLILHSTSTLIFF